MLRLVCLLLVLLAFGCAESSLPGDGGVASDVPRVDVPRFDAPSFDAPRFDVPQSVDAPIRFDATMNRDSGPRDAGPADVPVDSSVVTPADRARESFLALCEAELECGMMPTGFCIEPDDFVDSLFIDVAGRSMECMDTYANLIADLLECAAGEECAEISRFIETGEVSALCSPDEEEFRNVEVLCEF
ncbi:MAG: hypothetical protein AB8H86_30645 [Polyangiales bacterium]